MGRRVVNEYEQCRDIIKSFRSSDLASIDVILQEFAFFEESVQTRIKLTLEDISALQREEKELEEAEYEFI